MDCFTDDERRDDLRMATLLFGGETWNAMATACAAAGSCPLGDDPQQATARFRNSSDRSPTPPSPPDRTAG